MVAKKKRGKKHAASRRARTSGVVRKQPASCCDSGVAPKMHGDPPRMISLDDLVSGRVQVALGLESEEENNVRNERMEAVYEDQRKRGWPGL